MKAVGVKVLKNQLSRYLKEVQAGEVIWVTERDRVIAEIHKPISPLPGRVSRWEAFVNDQERRGKLRRPVRDDVSMRSALTLPRLPRAVDLAKILDQVRADRE